LNSTKADSGVRDCYMRIHCGYSAVNQQAADMLL
jgi:hypothetical protein